MKTQSPNYVHLWVPNLFEFKGGIQVYLQDLLSVLYREFPDQRFYVFDKLDKVPPPLDRYGQNVRIQVGGY